ncbi:MAG: hypothetical protein U9N81_10665 [Bacillota bacterium]|nr:hypothetical protein [Bacillota bacterium]
MSVMLEDCSPSKTVTVSNLNKLKSEEMRLAKLNALATTNIKKPTSVLSQSSTRHPRFSFDLKTHPPGYPSDR